MDEVRYCTTEDGVRIAYCVEGEGPALLVCPITAFESFSLESLMPELEDFLRRIGAGRTLVRFDMRGTGLSERRVEDLSLDATVCDLRVVADEAGLERFALWAPGLSGPKAIKYVAQNPGRVSALILYGTFARARDAYTVGAIEAFAALAESNWELFCRTINDLGAARTEAGDAPLRAAEYAAQSADGETIARWIRENEALDVTPCLTDISTRTLVVHRIAHSIYPVALGQALAAAIPGARLVTPPGAIAGYMWGDVKSIIDPINRFLDEDPETRRLPSAGTESAVREPSGALRTVLFTDVAGSTEMMSRLGDERGRDVLREHERITREVLAANGGTEVKTMGDGFMASFGSVRKAVECAIALQRAFAEREGEPLSVRIGLNAGEPIEEDGDLFGATVILASRIAAQAQGGEILVADTVRGLCSGKGFLFADRGEFVAKGFEEPVRLYEVTWRE
jgi:class 3 adenylate cyclase/pimeloyl-ACP methyl ester carboxylesterase